MKERKIIQAKGYSSNIGILVSMMDNVRKVTLDMTQDLTEMQLDYNFDKKSNSIGTLLFHISALEYIYQVKFFKKRLLKDDEIKKWGKGLSGNMSGRNIHGNKISYYRGELIDVRDKTLLHLKTKDDEWLNSILKIGDDMQASLFYMLFVKFHKVVVRQLVQYLVLKIVFSL